MNETTERLLERDRERQRERGIKKQTKQNRETKRHKVTRKYIEGIERETEGVGARMEQIVVKEQSLVGGFQTHDDEESFITLGL